MTASKHQKTDRRPGAVTLAQPRRVMTQSHLAGATPLFLLLALREATSHIFVARPSGASPLP